MSRVVAVGDDGGSSPSCSVTWAPSALKTPRPGSESSLQGGPVVGAGSPAQPTRRGGVWHRRGRETLLRVRPHCAGSSGVSGDPFDRGRNVPKVGAGTAEPSSPGGAERGPGASASRGLGLRSALHPNGCGRSPGVGGRSHPSTISKPGPGPKPGGRDADIARVGSRAALSPGSAHVVPCSSPSSRNRWGRAFA